MFTRIISGIVGILMLVGVLYLGGLYITLGFALVSLIAIYELFKALEKKGFHPIKSIAYLWVLGIFFIPKIFPRSYFDIRFFSVALFVTIISLLLLILFNYKKYNIADIGLTIAAVIYIPFLMHFVPLLRELKSGEYLVWVAFLGAWGTDTAAYFGGVSFGKRKIIPHISPKKTLEGSIFGVLGSVLAITILGYFLIKAGLVATALYHFIIIGLICGIISQPGDWTASAIKRYADVKDFGKIMPGHGGALDRFDSILFIAPFVYFYFEFIIL